MPARKPAALRANALRPARQPFRPRDADYIPTHRDHLMTELARLRKNCGRENRGSEKVIDNVQQLLTRWWSPASWHARKELLKTAEWFLQLERTDGNGCAVRGPRLADGPVDNR